VTALAKLIRTTTFKLTLVYLTVFAVFAVLLLGYFAWNTQRLITQQITETVDAEIIGLSEQYRQGGIRRLVVVVESRARRPGSSLYLVTTFSGEALAGNVGSLAPGVLDKPGWAETLYRRQDESEGAEHHAVVRVFQLPGGFRLLVGRDLEERERLQRIITDAGRWSIALVIVLGLGGGFFVTRRVLKRIDAMSETTRRIMAGDLGGRYVDPNRRLARADVDAQRRDAGCSDRIGEEGQLVALGVRRADHVDVLHGRLCSARCWFRAETAKLDTRRCPPLSCRTSPPQGGRLAGRFGGARSETWAIGEIINDSQSPPLRGRAIAYESKGGAGLARPIAL